jgi:UDP-glucuronate 4-epimerase
VSLKEARVATLAGHPRFTFRRLDLADADATAQLFRDGRFTHVVHLAAQPGVRYSLVNPGAYLRNNVDAFGNVLEGCRHAGFEHLVYASSSSVYGANHTLPFSEDQPVDHPVSLYAATKKANELMAHSYSHLFRLPTTGLRFFTVYGPWGRPDQAPMLFTKAILAGTPIQVFNDGNMERDFHVRRRHRRGRGAHAGARAGAGGKRARRTRSTTSATTRPCRCAFIATLERLLGRTALRESKPMQPGDVPGDLRVDRPAARGNGLRAAHVARRRSRALCRVVSRVLPDLTATIGHLFARWPF